MPVLTIHAAAFSVTGYVKTVTENIAILNEHWEASTKHDTGITL